MSGFRLERVEARIAHIISDLIVRGEVKDHRVRGMFSISAVECSKDGAYAKVRVSSYLAEEDMQKVVAGLNHASGFIQRILGKHLHTRHTPKLTFVVDTSLIQSFEIASRLKELSSETDSPQSDTDQ